METHDKSNTTGVATGVVYGNVGIGETTYEMNKFHGSQGHGFAAERAGHLHDLAHGNQAQILGDNNAKNGADRLVNGIEIQCKYCRTGAACIQECFENGEYRYYSADGKPMQIEVPADMYDEAVNALKRRITNGEMKGITNPDDAQQLVRKGHYTYQQAKQIAQSGTIESLLFDSANGAIICTNAMGVTAVITFATSLWNGEGFGIALENAVLSGLKVGGVSFLTTVISAQIARTSINSSVRLGTDYLVKKLGSKATAYLANSLNGGVNIYGEKAMSNVSKLIAGNIISSAVSFVILSLGDIVNLFRGRISGGQFVKNAATTGATIAGGNGGWVAGKTIGAAAGAAIGGALTGGIGAAQGAKIGSAIGGFAGSAAGGAAAGAITHSALDTVIEDDSVMVMKIVESEYTKICERYLLTENEVYESLNDLKAVLTSKELKNIFASSNREAYAASLIMRCVSPILQRRQYIKDAYTENILSGVRGLIEDAIDGTGIFDESETIPSVETVKQNLLVERNIRDEQIPVIMQPVVQLNRTQQRAERALVSMKRDNEATAARRQELKSEREAIKQGLKTPIDI